MRIASVRGMAIIGSVAAVLLSTTVAPAAAEPVFASELAFSPDNPTYDPYGQGTTLWGAVNVTQQGWLDFYGRSVVETPSRANLNPGTSDFTFGARIALTRGVGRRNVMQKGNFGDQQWKLSTTVVSGEAGLSCRFSGSGGAVFVTTNQAVIPTDGSWHEVACSRAGNTVRVLVDGVTVAQGSGPIGSISSTKPYLIGSKGAGNLAAPDQYLGLLDNAFVAHDGGGVVVNNAPRADLQVVGCTQLSCTFDASASSDPEGEPLTFTWDLGDGTQAAGSSVVHDFTQPGTYTVLVEVRDPQGAASVASATVNVAETPSAPITFRAVSGANTQGTSITPRIPLTVQPSDALLLYVAANRSDVTLQAPAGWQSLGRRTDGSMQSQLWTRVAQPGDADALVRVISGGSTKMTAHLIAYAGTNGTQPVASAISAAESATRAAHTTPVASASPDAWVVSLWSNKSSSTTGWTAPGPATVRQFQTTAGGGRVTSLVADSAGPIGAASAGGLTAVASQSGGKATMWTVVLAPGG